MPEKVVLFDIDGVLLHPGGYRAGLRQSLAYFLSELGLGDRWLPDEAEVAAFESIGITAEWDMIPIWLAFVLKTLAENTSGSIDWPDWPAAASWARGKQVSSHRDSLVETILALRPLLAGGAIPSDSVCAACLQPHVELLHPVSGQGVFRALLDRTRDFSASRTTRVFQAFILGSETYEQVYQRTPPVTCSSALEEFDRPFLSPQMTERIESLCSQNQLSAAAFTARPSLPLDGQRGARAGYSPEAEIALRTLGMNRIPLVGYGAMVYLADQYGLQADSLLKPAPFQALAAISAACTGEVRSSLDWAYDYSQRFTSGDSLPLTEEKNTDRPASLPKSIDLYVFEDTRSGVLSARRAAELLRIGGIQVRVHALGIATNRDKKTALEQVGAVVYPDIDQAIRAAFPDWF